jgi:hypothetical protein
MLLDPVDRAAFIGFIRIKARPQVYLADAIPQLPVIQDKIKMLPLPSRELG